MTKAELEEAVFQALGEASMCWSETPSGVFEDVRAMEIGNKLVAAIMGAQEEAQGPHEAELWNNYVKAREAELGKNINGVEWQAARAAWAAWLETTMAEAQDD